MSEVSKVSEAAEVGRATPVREGHKGRQVL